MGLSTDKTITQVGQLHNNFPSIHHRLCDIVCGSNSGEIPPGVCEYSEIWKSLREESRLKPEAQMELLIGT